MFSTSPGWGAPGSPGFAAALAAYLSALVVACVSAANDSLAGVVPFSRFLVLCDFSFLIYILSLN